MKTFVKPILFVCAVAICGSGVYTLWRMAGSGRPPGHTRKVLYYQDSMHPWIKSDQPGKCTVCGMDLTPILEGQSGFGMRDGMVALSSNNVTVLNVQTEEVTRRPLSHVWRVAGTLEPNDAQKTVIATPSPGLIQSSAVEFTGVEVEKGQVLVTLFSPDLVQRRAFLRSVGGAQTIAGYGLAVGKGLLQDSSNSSPYLGDITAPRSGVVVERNVYPGQYVVEGEKLFIIVDASVLWFRFDVYEQQVPWLKLGQTMEVTTASVPGKRFPAVISFIEPTLNDPTRTVKVRADIMNPVVSTNGGPQRLLRFGMYAEGRLRTEIRNVLAVPRTAILFPGGAAYAYVCKGDGVYQRRRVQLGRQGEGRWEVLRGLEEGDRVVTSGNVLIDAQAQFNQGDSEADLGGGDVAAAPPVEDTADAERAMSQAAASEIPPAILSSDGALTPSQHRALTAFLAVADAISGALAADNLDQLKTHLGALPGVASSLAKEMGGDHPWHALLKRIEASARWPVPADLAAARRAFLPFSTQVVELVQLVRENGESFQSLKVYHCPMAPKPGLWFQAKGPLRNPYYGADMLTCGNEVPSATSVPSATRAVVSSPAQIQPLANSFAAMSDNPPVLATTGHPPMAGMVGDHRSPGDRPQPVDNSTAAMSSNPPPIATNKPPPITGAGTNLPSPAEHPPHPSTDHSRAMAAVMSPASERQMVRRASILKGLEMDAAAAGKPMEKRMQDPAFAPGVVEPEVQHAVRRQQALTSFMEVADGIGQALASDDLPQYYERIVVLPTVFTLLRQEVGTNEPLYRLVQQAIRTGLPLASAGQWRTTKDLTGARALFLPFSTATVELAKSLKQEGESFASLKIYQSPTSPKPELWIQAKGPPRNPFQGPKAPTSGEEVKL